MLTGYVVRIYPTEEQEGLIRRSGGACRFLYNRLLDWEKSIYEKEKRFVSEYELNSHILDLKKENPWLAEVNAQSLQQVSKNLVKAYKAFFRKKAGFPKFKKKRNGDSFSNPQSCRLDFRNHTVHIPKAGDIEAVFHRRIEGTLRSVTIRIEKGGKYSAVLLMEDGKKAHGTAEAFTEEEIAKFDVLGIDLGIKEMAVCSDGRVFHNIKSARRYDKLLRRRQKALSRKQKGSKNRDKARVKVAKVQEKAKAARNDAIHKMTSQISESQADVIAIEDLNVKGMLKNRNLAYSLSDVSFGEIRRQLEYKCARKGKILVVIPRFARSTQACSHCGYVNRELKGSGGLSIRTWECPVCHTVHDRDGNASKMIAKLGRDSLPRVAGEVKPAERPTVDDKEQSPKKQCPELKEAGKVSALDAGSSIFRMDDTSG